MTVLERPSCLDETASPEHDARLHRSSSRLSRWLGWAREDLQLALLPFVPTQSARLGRLYNIVGSNNLFGEGTLFVNLGYWANGPTSLDDAAVELARLLAREAELGPSDVVLDVGCGFGDQDLLWHEEFAAGQIIGVNVSKQQIAVSERRARAAGKESSIGFIKASAMDLPRADSSCTKVTALESAFHFPSRVRFFEEAHRVLAPDGRLVTADLVLRTDVFGRRVQRALQRFSSSPLARIVPNILDADVLDADGYRTALRRAGFDDVNVYSVREHVYPPLVRYVAKRVDDPDMRGVNPLLRMSFRPPMADAWTQFADYVIAVAHKGGNA